VNTLPCTSRSNDVTCGLVITEEPPFVCSTTILTLGAIAISDNNS